VYDKTEVQIVYTICYRYCTR